MGDTNFISQADAAQLLGREDVSFVDASWYLPAQNRDGLAEYRQMRIPGAVYFDIDAIADPSTDLPHMLPDPIEFGKQVSMMGISDQNLIIVYDGPGLFSSARAWWTFKVMGAPDVRILEGGIDGWKKANLPLETGHPNPPRAHLFEVFFSPAMVADLDAMERNMRSGEAIVLDARPNDRFKGISPEPRPGLRSGHIPGSTSLPFTELMENGKLASAEKLDRIFTEMGIATDTPVITSCGSGVTAAIITLALAQTGRNNHRLFDGSWAQWGKPDGPPVSKNE